MGIIYIMTKHKYLRLIILFMLIVSTFCLSACSSINATTQINDDGTIDEYVVVNIDDNDLINQGYSSSQILSLKTDVQDIGKNASKKLCNEFNSRVQTAILLATTQDEIDELKSYLNGVTALKGNSANALVFGIRFKNASVYRYYYNIFTYQAPNYKYEKHFLYTKVYYYGLTMYADYTSLYNSIKAELSAQYPEIVANNKAQLSYTYETDMRREHSDADYITSKNGKYYHTWIVDNDDFEKPVMIYYNIANSGNCILICIGITIVLCGVLLMIALIIEKCKGKKSKQI